MNITLTLGTWMVPLAITILTLIGLLILHCVEDGNWLDFCLSTLIGVPIIITAWVVWLIMTIMAK
jgi:hypothetical protein